MIPPKAVAKIGKRIEHLQPLRYAKVMDVELELAETMEHFRKPPNNLDYQSSPVGTQWGREWGTGWFRSRVQIPVSCKGRRVYFRILTNGENLLYVNGRPFAGMDHFHHEVLLTKQAKGGERFLLHVEAYAGHPYPGINPFDAHMRYMQYLGGPEKELPLTLEKSELVVEREETAALYYEADMLYRTAVMLDENSLRRAEIIDALNAALDLVPVHWETEQELESTCRAARKRIAGLLKKTNSPTTPFIGLVGHAHIDVAWLWPLKESIRKAARTFSTFLRLMEDYPELTFLQSQPVLMDMVQKHYPSLVGAIQAKVHKGAWQPNGGMWVEADCNLSSGEALVRQFLEGRKKTMELFGYAGDTLWLPDVFGYSAALPQIMKQCEVDNFVTSKINWNDTNPFPYDTFWWEGIDGTELFTHYITCRINGYNADVAPEMLLDCWNQVQRKDIQDRVISSVGWGDGGGGVTREMCERARRLRDLEGCPRSGFVNVSKFLRELREQPVKRPRWVGELYLELHRGTYTSQARTKRYNRKLELLLRDVEFYSVLAMQHGLRYPAADLERLWRVVLTNQFHDILPGSSIRQVYETAEAEYAQAESELNSLKHKALSQLGKTIATSGPGAPVLVGNSLSWTREDIVCVDGVVEAHNAEGEPLPSQKIEWDGRSYTVVLAKTESLSVTPIFTKKKSRLNAESPFRYRGNSLDTPQYRVRFDKAGKIISLYDKAAKRESVQPGRRFNEIYTAEDYPTQWDAWDIDRFYRDTIKTEDRLESREVASDGPVCFVLRSKYRMGRSSTLSQDMVFYAHTRRIDFRTVVDWNETHVLLKVGFPINVLADTYRSEIQYGHVVRNSHSNTSFDEAKFETCAHKWVDVSETGYGVALLNDCKYGHDALDNMLSITLLRSTIAPDYAADQGRHEFTYSVLPHNGDFSVEHVVREAYALNVPLTAQPVAAGKGTEHAVSLCRVSNENVIIEAVKKAEADDSIVVRLYEAGKSRGPVKLEFSRPIKKVAACNLLERQDTKVSSKGNDVVDAIRPFEIKTYKVDLKKV